MDVLVIKGCNGKNGEINRGNGGCWNHVFWFFNFDFKRETGNSKIE